MMLRSNCCNAIVYRVERKTDGNGDKAGYLETWYECAECHKQCLVSTHKDFPESARKDVVVIVGR